MKSSVGAAVSRRLPIVSKCNLGARESWFGRRQAKANQAEDETSRYRRGWDAGVMAGLPGSAVGTQDSAASTRADAIAKDANWVFSAASQTVNITKLLYPEDMRRVTPFGHRTFGGRSAHEGRIVQLEVSRLKWKSGDSYGGQPLSAVRRAKLDWLLIKPA
jgi:hypothetical protein